MPIDEELICRQARTLWTRFSRAHGSEKATEGFLKFDPEIKLSFCPAVGSLFRYVTEDLFATTGSVSLSVQLGDAASWLWDARDARDGSESKSDPQIMINATLKLDGNPYSNDERRLYIVRTRLILHEIGHIVLHWQDLLVCPGRASPSTPQQEKEAWFFTHAMLGLALGQYSQNCRESPSANNIDDAWQYLV